MVGKASGWKLSVVGLLAALLVSGVVQAQQQCLEQNGKLEALRKELARKDFIVQCGSVTFPGIVGLCCQCKLPTCYGNNASSTYGFFALPPAPDQDPAVKNPYAEWFTEDQTLGKDWSYQWRLRPDEAVVFLGPTPPKVDYFGFTGYVYDRFVPTMTKDPPQCVSGDIRRDQPASSIQRFPVFASLGDTINPLTINLAGGKQDPYQKDVVVVMAADQNIERKVHKALIHAGYPEESINFIALPPSIARIGLESENDSFMIAMRVAPIPGTDVSQYYDNDMTPKTFLRLSPATPVPPQKLHPVPPPKLRVRGTGKTEVSLLSAVDTLGQAIIDRYPDYTARAVKMTTIPDGYNCLENMQNCLGDNRDTVFIPPAYDIINGRILPNQPALTVAPDEFLVAYGVIHPSMNKATYSNISIMGWGLKAAPAVVHNQDMAGSGRYFLTGTGIDPETADKLYAFKIARDGGCHGQTDGQYCIPIGTDCENGIALDEPVAPVFRAYLEPATAVGPAWGEVILDRIIKFTPPTPAP